MEARELMDLYDSYWFEMEIFRKRPSSTQASSSDQNPGDQNQEHAPRPEILRVPTIITRSMSEQISFILSPDSDSSFSPDSVLSTPKLQTIFSGKEVIEENEEISASGSPEIAKSEEPGKKRSRSKRGKKGNRSKSLSELEFEELKGFMDLGFVFSEEDKDSSLVSIIPGLQRLGKDRDEENEKTTNSPVNSEAKVSRPYLSEAWEVLERNRRENPLVNWRIPAVSNEIDMKDNLRWWAQTVASSVR